MMAIECPKHAEHIISAINHSVAYSWFFFCMHIITINRYTAKITKILIEMFVAIADSGS